MRQPNGSVFCRGEHSVNHVVSRKSMQFHGKNYRESTNNMDFQYVYFYWYQNVLHCIDFTKFIKNLDNTTFAHSSKVMSHDFFPKFVRTPCTSLLPSTHFIFFKPHFLTPFTLPHPFRSSCET